MRIEQKIFRKFFYENSSFIESESVFGEITDAELVKKIGLKEGEVACFMNKNKYEKFTSNKDNKIQNIKFFNLDLEVMKSPKIE